MLFHYLVRRIHPTNSQHPPTCQLVYCNQDNEKVVACMETLKQDPKLKDLVNVSYAVETHEANITGKSLELMFMEKIRLAQHKRAPIMTFETNQQWSELEEISEPGSAIFI